MRVDYVGELGWELHIPIANQARSTVRWWPRVDYGLKHFGMYAMDSLRIDKCYRGWKSDLEAGYSPFEASLDRFIDLSKPDFPGKGALILEKARGVRQRLVPLTLDDPGDADAPYCSSVFSGNESVGLATSGVWSHTMNRSVVLAYVRSDFTEAGTKLSVDIYGERRAATVGREPLFDPENLRSRS